MGGFPESAIAKLSVRKFLNQVTPIILDDRIINQNLAQTIRSIDALKYREDIELLPTQHARITAIALVKQAAIIRPNYFFAPWISGDEDGGVRVGWSRPSIDAQVRLIVPPTAKSKDRVLETTNTTSISRFYRTIEDFMGTVVDEFGVQVFTFELVPDDISAELWAQAVASFAK